MTHFARPFVFTALLALPSIAQSQPTPPAPSPTSPQAPTPTPTDVATRAVGVTDDEAEQHGLVRGGLTADRAAERAVATAASISRADAAVRLAEAGAMQAMASVLPHLELRGRATYTNPIVNNLGQATPEQLELSQTLISNVTDPSAQILFQQIILGSANINFPYYRSQYELSATLTYPVTASLLTLLPMYRAAGRQVDAARLQRDTELAQIALRAREAFYEHVRARGANTAAVESRVAALAHRDRLVALVEAGVASRADLLAVEAQLASAEVAVRNAELGVSLSARALALLISGDDEDLPTIEIGENVSVPTPMPTESIDALEARALSERPELRALSLAREARRMEVRAQSFARYPQLALQGGVQYANPNARYIPQERRFQSSWDVSAVLSWSPNDALVAEGRRRQASAALSQVESQEQDLRDAVRLEVTQAYQSLVSAHATHASALASVAAAEESFRVRMAQLEQGVGVSTEVADARTALTHARLQLVDASVGMRIARARLGRALGEGTER